MKTDEKISRPMFPRLHVNEREKGGPKAPPRNKMALYEQLSIPSQRFSSVNFNNISSTASSTQGSENKGPMLLPLHLSRSRHSANNSNATSSVAPQKKLDEEDFAVPVFVQPENGQDLRNTDSMDQENASLTRPAQIKGSSRNQSTCNEEQKLNSAAVSNLRQKDRFHSGKPQCPAEDQENREHLTNDVDRLESTSYSSHHEVIEEAQLQNASNRKHKKYKTRFSLEIQNGNKCEEDSDTSMLDSISGMDMSPDDVVGVIGQKYFWKARRAIVNQQRVFSVQVFELHRLIKVQKLFAGSPDVLLEDSAYLGKGLKTSIPKELSLQFVVKPSENIEKRKLDQLKNPTEKAEGYSEKALRKSSFSNKIPIPSNPSPTPVTADPNMSPWYLNQPTGHHWLIPVMSPTEGLIYKPYPGHAHTGSNHMISNFSNPYFPSLSHAYFPPYDMPPVGPSISTVDQEVHFIQTSFNEPQNTDMPNFASYVNTRVDKEGGLQVSTPSHHGEGRNGLRLSSTSPDDDVSIEKHSKLIKVVPHNAVSANESAFRIFRSIQKDREHNEST